MLKFYFVTQNNNDTPVTCASFVWMTEEKIEKFDIIFFEQYVSEVFVKLPDAVNSELTSFVLV